MSVSRTCLLWPVALTLSLGAPATLAAPAHAAAVTLQANPQHSGYVPHGGPVPPLRRRWSAPLDPRVGYPVIAGGMAFVITRRYEAYTLRLRVVALSLATGRRIWQRDLSSPDQVYDAALGVDNGRLFVTRDIYTRPQDGALMALSPADGHVLWQTSDLTLFEAIPPVAQDGVVYLSETGGGASGISARSESDGTLVWRASTNLGAGGAVALSTDTAYTGTGCEPHVFGVRRSDGAPLSSTTSGCSSGSGTTPVLSDHHVLLSGGAGGRDMEGDYDERGVRIGALRSDYIPAVAGGITLVSNARIPGEDFLRGHTLSALANGTIRWRFRGDGYLDSAPLVAGRTVYVGSGSGRVYGVDLYSGRLRWRGNAGSSVLQPRSYPIQTGLAAADGTLLVPARGRLVAFG